MDNFMTTFLNKIREANLPTLFYEVIAAVAFVTGMLYLWKRFRTVPTPLPPEHQSTNDPILGTAPVVPPSTGRPAMQEEAIHEVRQRADDSSEHSSASTTSENSESSLSSESEKKSTDTKDPSSVHWSSIRGTAPVVPPSTGRPAMREEAIEVQPRADDTSENSSSSSSEDSIISEERELNFLFESEKTSTEMKDPSSLKEALLSSIRATARAVPPSTGRPAMREEAIEVQPRADDSSENSSSSSSSSSSDDIIDLKDSKSDLFSKFEEEFTEVNDPSPLTEVHWSPEPPPPKVIIPKYLPMITNLHRRIRRTK